MKDQAMSPENDLNLPPLNQADLSFDQNQASVAHSGPVPVKTAEDLLQIVPGAVLELDRRVGEAIDIFVNERLVARGEVVVVEDRLGVTMTEIIKADR